MTHAGTEKGAETHHAILVPDGPKGVRRPLQLHDGQGRNGLRRGRLRQQLYCARDPHLGLGHRLQRRPALVREVPVLDVAEHGRLGPLRPMRRTPSAGSPQGRAACRLAVAVQVPAVVFKLKVGRHLDLGLMTEERRVAWRERSGERVGFRTRSTGLAQRPNSRRIQWHLTVEFGRSSIAPRAGEDARCRARALSRQHARPRAAASTFGRACHDASTHPSACSAPSSSCAAALVVAAVSCSKTLVALKPEGAVGHHAALDSTMRACERGRGEGNTIREPR